MKVKNIMFAGFASAILSGVCGAASAADYNLVTQGYVTEQLAGKADAGASYTKAEADDLLADKVSTETYAAYIETQEDVDEAQDAKIQANTAAIDGLSGVDGTGFATMQQDITTLKTAVNDENGAVAQKIATAIAAEELRADGKYQEKGEYALKSELPTDYVTTQDLTDAGYATTNAMNAALQGKQDTITDLTDIRAGAELGKTAVQPGALESYVTTQDLTEAGYATTSEMETALQGKQGTITDLDTIRSGAALGATAMQSIGDGTVTKAMLAEGVQASLDAADTAVQPSALDDYVTTENLNAAGYQTEAQVEAEIAGATIQQSQVSGLDTALAGKQAAGNYLTDTMENPGTYLVQRDGEGNISYVSVEIVGETPAQE